MKADSKGFFDSGPYAQKYPPQIVNRQNERYKRIIEANIGHIKGRRILDLAAHDGRWTWAALETGASYVQAVEGRAALVAEANRVLCKYAPERYSFIQGDIFEYLTRKTAPVGQFDTVLCLGIFYHISDHSRLLSLVAALRPTAIIIDSALMRGDEQKIVFTVEDTSDKLNAIPGEAGNVRAMVGTVSQGWLKLWAQVNGWTLTYVPWKAADIANPASLEDYLTPEPKSRARFTCVLTQSSGKPGSHR